MTLLHDLQLVILEAQDVGVTRAQFVSRAWMDAIDGGHSVRHEASLPHKKSTNDQEGEAGGLAEK